MHNLRLELEQKISGVNEQIVRLREQQIQQTEEATRERQQHLEEEGDQSAPDEPSVTLQEHNQQLQAEKAALQQVQQRLHELELTNAQLVEHNMVLLRGTLQQQQHAHDGAAAEEKERDRDRDNGSVFSIDKSAYQSQVAQLSQQASVLEQQKMQIERYVESIEEMERQVQQVRLLPIIVSFCIAFLTCLHSSFIRHHR